MSSITEVKKAIAAIKNKKPVKTRRRKQAANAGTLDEAVEEVTQHVRFDTAAFSAPYEAIPEKHSLSKEDYAVESTTTYTFSKKEKQPAISKEEMTPIQEMKPKLLDFYGILPRKGTPNRILQLQALS